MENEYSRYLQGYGLRLLNDFPENTVFIIGNRSALMGQYYIPLTGSKKYLIWSGWKWPRKRLVKTVEYHFSRNKRIIIDLEGFRLYPVEMQDVMNLIYLYKTKDAGNNLIELYK